MKIKTIVKTDGFIANRNQTTTRNLMVQRLATRILQWSVAVIIISGLCSLDANTTVVLGQLQSIKGGITECVQ